MNMHNPTIARLRAEQPALVARLGRLFETGRLAHAYIIEGPHGAGIEEVERLLTARILCERPAGAEPCGTCRQCRLLASGASLQAIALEPDGAFIRKEQIERLIREFSRTARETGARVCALREADRLHPAAANTLLKFLEEPDTGMIALLTTERPHALLDTIRSRCQSIALAPLPRESRKRRLREAGMTDALASTVAALTQSGEEAAALGASEDFLLVRKYALQLIAALHRELGEALLLIQSQPALLAEKDETERLLDLLLLAYRDIVASKAGQDGRFAYPDMEKAWSALALRLSYRHLAHAMTALLAAKQRVHQNMNRTLLLEQLMMDLQEGK